MAKQKLNIFILVYTSAQAHAWRQIIQNLKERGHNIKVFTRPNVVSGNILGIGNEDIEVFESSKNKVLRYAQFPGFLLAGSRIAGKFKPDVLLGFGILAAISGFLTRKPCIAFVDSEPVPVQNFLTKLFADKIVVPISCNVSFGKKQLSVSSYKELGYLHPNYFSPDPAIFSELGLKDTSEKYAVLRFSSFNALHDIGRHGFSNEEKIQLVHQLEKHLKVFITPEDDLPGELEKYRLPTAYHRIHHVLYYAQILIGDSQTSTTEAALLGTPAVRCNNFVGPNDMGNFIELETKYDMIYSFSDAKEATRKAIELVTQADLKEKWAVKRQILLADKIDFAGYFVDLIENQFRN